jgi:hypothetical protein
VQQLEQGSVFDDAEPAGRQATPSDGSLQPGPGLPADLPSEGWGNGEDDEAESYRLLAGRPMVEPGSPSRCWSSSVLLAVGFGLVVVVETVDRHDERREDVH